MTEEVKLEDLQKQILDLQKKLEEATTSAESNAKQLEDTKATLEKARDLNADLMSKVPGAPNDAKQEDDGFDSLTPEEQFEACLDHVMQEATEKWLAKRKVKS